MTNLSSETIQAIREAFRAGRLKTLAVDPTTGVVSLHVVGDVMRHQTSHKNMVRTSLMDGREVVTTVDHSLFLSTQQGIEPIEAGKLKSGDSIATVVGTEVLGVPAYTVEQLPPEEFTYDLSVPGPENFVISNGVVAHNSYSIGGISLDLDKSSKYDTLKQGASDQFDKQLEKAKATVKFIKGLQQPKYGMGVRSAFGPFQSRGAISPRKFMGI